jgi:hypothetical protein
VIFYTAQDPLLLNGKFNNLEYGAAAPGAPQVFLNDAQFQDLWTSRDRYYLVASQNGAERIENIVGQAHFTVVAASGGKLLLTNLASNSAFLASPTEPAQAAAQAHPLVLLESNARN